METIRRNTDEQPPQPPPPPPQKCPRCESSNTKFCYYNNYSLSQPRYFCKACRRYWTQGGTLRNVPIGGGCRKNKRSKGTTTGANEVVKSQSLSSGQQQTLNAGMISGQPFRSSLPPVLSSLAAMQALPAVNVGVGAQFGGNMALLQGVNYQSLVRSQAPLQQFPAHDEFVNPQRPLNIWSPQRFINGVAPSSSAGFWGGYGHMDNGDQGSSSFNTNNHLGFNPSQ